MGSERRVFLGGFFMVAENYCRTKLTNKGQVPAASLPTCRMPKGCRWFIWMPIVILAVLAPTMWWLATK